MAKFYSYFMLVLMASCSWSALASSLETANGIEVLYVNGQKAQSDQAIQFVEGTLQLVVRYNGRLKASGKRQFYSTYPYVVTVKSADAQHAGETMHLALISNWYDEVKTKNENKQPLFKISADQAVQVEQAVLPATDKVFPYMKIGVLVKRYNAVNHTIFSDGDGQESVVGSQPMKKGQPANANAVDQLKFWYTEATKDERKAFRYWMINQD